MKSLSCFQCVQKEDRQDKCTHHGLGQLKYKPHCNENSVALPEEIVCEPIFGDQSHEGEPSSMYELTWENIKTGSMLLFHVDSAKSVYLYVCSVLEKDNEDSEFIVQGLRRSNADATEYIVKDNDVFTIPYESIKQILPEPTPIWKKRILTYKFPNMVGVYEK